MNAIPVQKNVILSCQISGVYDVNRSAVLEDDDYSLVREWAESIAASRLCGIIFHNNFSDSTCSRFENEYVSFEKIEYDGRFNPNVFRYFVYNNYIKKHSSRLENLFVTDVSDVVLLNNPFTDPLFVANKDCLFCGDEPELLDIYWMKDHSTHLRGKIDDFASFEELHKNDTLLNCGIIGGNILLMKSFIEKLSLIHQVNNADNNTAYTGDMGAFNYLARTKYSGRIIHGSPVNTVFKGYESQRRDCWFKHK
jgi:hypothetical protein